MLWLVSFAFSKEEEDEEEEDGQSVSLPVFHTSCDIFIQFFAGSYFFTCSPP